jgi:hypothetical protein
MQLYSSAREQWSRQIEIKFTYYIFNSWIAIHELLLLVVVGANAAQSESERVKWMIASKLKITAFAV